MAKTKDPKLLISTYETRPCGRMCPSIAGWIPKSVFL